MIDNQTNDLPHSLLRSHLRKSPRKNGINFDYALVQKIWKTLRPLVLRKIQPTRAELHQLRSRATYAKQWCVCYESCPVALGLAPLSSALSRCCTGPRAPQHRTSRLVAQVLAPHILASCLAALGLGPCSSVSRLGLMPYSIEPHSLRPGLAPRAPSVRTQPRLVSLV